MSAYDPKRTSFQCLAPRSRGAWWMRHVLRERRRAALSATQLPAGGLRRQETARWRNSWDHRLIIASSTGRKNTDIIEASMHRQCRALTRSDSPVLSDKMPGLPAIWHLHRYKQMQHIVTIIPPVPNLVHEPA